MSRLPGRPTYLHSLSSFTLANEMWYGCVHVIIPYRTYSSLIDACRSSCGEVAAAGRLVSVHTQITMSHAAAK